jgi:hypothetical protein
MGSKPLLLFLLLAVFCAPARAQLDLGSPQIPREEIDAYMEPFYRLIASAVGSDHFLPPARGLGWHAGLDAVAVPVPEGSPFENVALAVLPLFRAEGGVGAFGAGASGRALAWRDPRVGDLATFGAAFGYAREIDGAAFPITVSLQGAWDFLSFASSYVYRYRGSPLGLADRDVPGDYTLKEHVFSLEPALALRRGPWGAFLRLGREWANGDFRYLYYDPRDDSRQNIVSNLDVPAWRFAAGASWRGFRVEGGYRSFPYFAAGWAWVR